MVGEIGVHEGKNENEGSFQFHLLEIGEAFLGIDSNNSLCLWVQQWGGEFQRGREAEVLAVVKK